MSDLIRALGLTKRNAITLKVSSNTYRLISYEQSISYGLRPMRMGYNAISYAGIEEYAKLKRVKVDWGKFLRELRPTQATNNNIMIFNNKDFGQVRITEINSKPYAVANDILKALGYAEGSWVFDEVLPTIRKTGGYVNNSTKFVDNYFSNFSTALRKEMIKELDSKIKTLSNVKEKVDKQLLETINAIDEIKNTL